METQPLDFWEAEFFNEVLGADQLHLPNRGRTMPLQLSVWRRNLSGKKESMQVVSKSVGHPEITTNWPLFAELFGNQLARHFEVQTAPPCIVRLSEPFVRSVRSNGKFQRQANGAIDLQSGYAAATQYLPGLARVSTMLDLPAEQKWGRRLFAFDMMVQNADRRTHNPNALLRNNEVLALDFELCFGFVFPIIGGAPVAWEVSEFMAKDHLFYKTLWGKQQDWSSYMSRLSALNCDTIQQAMDDITSAFPLNNNYAEKVLQHLCEVKNNADAFRRALDGNLR